ncbi:hypothetical protein J14TS2_38120 [Bacillus sp. J14TS2]|uniref:hypothetical protein n=1 Tax=Bacillus sp. J14TS2 TaxID=2807188 RepID=UPI001B0DF31C|nr:hypothetical protein [Bacillus sp. J14TS2]GIN73337.1 hypothetical protein J14TS2_38120 [Bacillus sp. J14TS2]
MESNLSTNKLVKTTWLSKWSHWVGYVAAIWSLCYGLLGIYWFFGGAGFPFGENDPRGEMMGSYLASLRSESGGGIIATAGWIGFIAAFAMVNKWGKGIARYILLTVAWIFSALLILIVPDSRIMQNFAYLFMFHFDLIDWIVVHQIFCIIGGFIWGAAAIAYSRTSRNACSNCGRTPGRTTAGSAARWGRWFTYMAVIFALPYGMVRWAWALGIPLGTNNMSIVGDFSGEAILGGLCIGGGILTFALIKRWGEVFPRWCLFLAGKQVPVFVVVMPAMLMSAIITLSGLKVFPAVFSMIIHGAITSENWGEMAPTLSWLPWGASLGVATWAYYQRRRSRCMHCGNI